MLEVDPGRPLGQYQIFYLGRPFDAKGKKAKPPGPNLLGGLFAIGQKDEED